MNKAIVLMFALVMATGCYGSQLSAIQRDVEQLRSDNRSLKQENARLLVRKNDKKVVGPLIGTNTKEKTRARVTGISSVVDTPKGGYHCYLDSDASAGGGNLLKLVNGHDRYWDQIFVNNQPVVVMQPMGNSYIPLLARADVSVLPPGRACYAPVGGRKIGRRDKVFSISATSYSETHS